MSARHLKLGQTGENLALSLLLSKGYKLLHRNWRSGKLELDLVCEKAGEIVFAEVKSRSSTCVSSPVDGLTRAKARNLVKAASLYLSENDLWDKPCRFDLVAVVFTSGEPEINHLEDVIDISQAFCGSDSHWQPW